LINRPINYIFIEGPDLSGKTTLYENIHKESDYRWNIQDRSALSMLVHAKYYGRDTFRHVEQLRSELYNLNNITIVLLPEWNEIARRFNLRGDPIQNITSLKKLYTVFEEAVKELVSLPNVILINGIVDNHTVKHTVRTLIRYENASTEAIKQNCITACDSICSPNKEAIGLNFTLYDNGEFEDVDHDLLLYDKEVEYYDNIILEIKQKIKNELAGNNQYNNKETLKSRRFIYNSDTCISLAHFLLRSDSLDCKFFLRSSNVKDTLNYDLNFLKHMASVVYDMLDSQGKFCRMNFVINSGHIIDEKQND